MVSGKAAAGKQAARLAEGIIGRTAKTFLRRAERLAGKDAAKVAARDASKIPQGFSRRQFERFARGARRLRKLGGLPEGDLVVQGSRVRRAAKNASDIDVALRVDDKTFFELSERCLARAPLGTKLRKSMLRRFNVKGQISSFDLGPEFQRLRQALLDSKSPYPVQFSVLRIGGALDTGPFLPL